MFDIYRDYNLTITITVADFDHFTDRSFGGFWGGTSKNDIILKNILFAIKGGNNHKLVRQTLTPAFTSSKLKIMLEVCTRNTVWGHRKSHRSGNNRPQWSVWPI